MKKLLIISVILSFSFILHNKEKEETLSKESNSLSELEVEIKNSYKDLVKNIYSCTDTCTGNNGQIACVIQFENNLSYITEKLLKYLEEYEDMNPNQRMLTNSEAMMLINSNIKMQAGVKEIEIKHRVKTLTVPHPFSRYDYFRWTRDIWTQQDLVIKCFKELN